MRDISYNPKPANNKARYVFAALLGSAMIAFAVCMLTPMYRGVVSMFMGAFLVAAILIYTRYIGSEYIYEIITSPGGYADFVVTHRIGKRRTVLCRVDVTSVVEVRLMNDKERRAYKSEPDTAVYSYHPTLMPESVYLLRLRSDTEKADLFIEAGAELAEILKESAREE